MNKISVAFPGYFTSERYYALFRSLGEELSFGYGLGFPKSITLPDDFPNNKMRCTKIPSRIASFIVAKLVKVFNMPQYYSYWTMVQLCDILFAKRLKSDPAKILFTTSMFNRTIKVAKQKGMIVVAEAGNSEANREHDRVMADYTKYGIKHKYIYGDTRFRDIRLKGLQMADYIVSISQVSLNTYRDAGYDMSKFKMIPLTGTDFPLQKLEHSKDVSKAFISTGFHNFVKGTQELLLAWRKAGIKEIPLIIVGRLCEDMQEFIEKYGPFDNVIYAGHNSNLREWYSTREGVGVLLSLSEGAVRVTPEMMSFGYPMIVSQDATCDLVVDGVNGFVIDTYDVDAISERLKWFAEDWSRVHDMRERVLKSVQKRTMTDYSTECGEYLKSILKGRY